MVEVIFGETIYTENFLKFLKYLEADGKESACNPRNLGLTLYWEDPLEKGKSTHSSILTWRITWTI